MCIIGVLGLSGLLAGCMPNYSASPTTDSGVEGYVAMGASCGTVSQFQDEDACRNKPMQTRLDITDTAGHSIVTVHSDRQGYYHVTLHPGEYILRPEKHPFLDVQPIPFKVSRKEFTRVNVVYLTGIK